MNEKQRQQIADDLDRWAAWVKDSRNSNPYPSMSIYVRLTPNHHVFTSQEPDMEERLMVIDRAVGALPNKQRQAVIKEHMLINATKQQRARGCRLTVVEYDRALDAAYIAISIAINNNRSDERAVV